MAVAPVPMKLQIAKKLMQCPAVADFLKFGLTYKSVPNFQFEGTEKDLQGYFTEPIKYAALAQVTEQMLSCADEIEKQRKLARSQVWSTIRFAIVLVAALVGSGSCSCFEGFIAVALTFSAVILWQIAGYLGDLPSNVRPSSHSCSPCQVRSDSSGR